MSRRLLFRRGINGVRAGKGLCLHLAVLGAVLLAGCERKAASDFSSPTAAAIVRVQTQKAENKQDTVLEEEVGTIRAKLRATLEAKLSGRITEMPVVLGQRVKRGQLMARLDAVEIQARFDQARAGLLQAERDWKRISALFTQQAVSRSEYETAQSRFDIAKAAQAEAEAMKAYVEIVAPFDGVVTKKWADVGDLAVPGKALIDMEDPSALQLEAEVPESSASSIQRDARMSVLVDGLDCVITGIVCEIGPSADPFSRTFRVKLELPNPGDSHAAPLASTPGAALGPSRFLMSGRFARLQVPIGTSSSIRVPVSAVVFRGQLEMVFVVVNSHAQLHLVKTGKRIGAQTEILAGIDPGDTVVAENANLLVDGQAVELR